ncbi:MAG: DUF1571 domain-containing protein [Fuerstiella sp.]
MLIRTVALKLALVAAAVWTSGVIPADEKSPPQDHPLAPAIRYARSCVERVEALPGYTATFSKREVVGNTTVSHQMKIKIRHKPFSVYLYFEKPHQGREVLYVEGQNDGKLIAHEAGLLSIAGSMELAPTDALAMNENRYPITMVGIANMVRQVIRTWEDEARYEGTEVKYFKDAKLGSMTCRVIESSHPRPFRQFKNHKIRLWVDSESNLPVRIQTFGFPKRPGASPPVIEDYVFTDLRTDVRLTDADFDRDNDKYSF